MSDNFEKWMNGLDGEASKIKETGNIPPEFVGVDVPGSVPKEQDDLPLRESERYQARMVINGVEIVVFWNDFLGEGFYQIQFPQLKGFEAVFALGPDFKKAEQIFKNACDAARNESNPKRVAQEVSKILSAYGGT
jgi:hypothetical protein